MISIVRVGPAGSGHFVVYSLLCSHYARRFYVGSFFCDGISGGLSSLATILVTKKSWLLCFNCAVVVCVLWLLLAMTRVSLQSAIVVLPFHLHLLFFYNKRSS